MNCSVYSYGLQAKSLPKQVQNVFKMLGIIRGPISPIDPLGEILSRRYGIPQWEGWKTLLRSEYAYALQLLAIADSAYHIARSQWLSYLNSFNHTLFIALQEYLHANRLAGMMKTKGKDGKLVKFGTLVDANQPFANHYPTIADGLRDANSRRNTLPLSHPYEVMGGARTRHLRKQEQVSLTEKLSKSYKEIRSLLSSP